MSAEALRVVLCWHMHQPEYRDPLTGAWQSPWTYLRTMKDYTDMAAHLEDAPEGVRAVVNFPPVLLEQITDYGARIRGFLDDNSDPGDPLLAALGAETMPSEPDRRLALLRRCLQAHETHMVARFAPYARLADLTRQALESDTGPGYLTDAHLADLLTWYHLAWLGETVRRRDPRIRDLMGREEGYSVADRRHLVGIIGELMDAVIGRYRALAEAGRLELSTSPYTHPILPLLLDFNSARQARPGITLPEASAYPGGESRAEWHLARSREAFHEHFGIEPAGCWPSEGAVCTDTLKHIGAAGFVWAASGEGVLRHSLDDDDPDSTALHRPYRVTEDGPACFFRDDDLADRIGFVYNDWHGDDAVADFIERLDELADEPGDGRVVAVILDGENPWEHYPDNGIHFVPALYRALVEHSRLHLTTFGECMTDSGVVTAALEGLVAGSWVYGDLNTWIGDPDKNRAWDLLCDAKAACDRKLPQIDDPGRRAAIERQLAVCEGSDWFWWFGDYNPGDAVTEFDTLFRGHLRALYRELEEPPPASLEIPISRGGGHPELGGTMRRGGG